MASRSAIVSGSSSGIGRAIAERLLADGWRVLGLDVAPASITHTSFAAHVVDLTDAAATRAAIDALLATGSPDALVHSAGVTRLAPLGALKDEDGQLLWQLHVDATTRLANRIIPAMHAAGRGRVVLIGSRVSAGMAGRSQYAACKAALVALAKSWAAEVVTAGVTVNVVSPAATMTPMLQDPARATTSPRMPPIGRFIEPREVAALVAYLLSDDAAAITGQDIAICGGASLRR
jgi:NAD(P)-dependent dehydrogenase (short-subunit alcohol dehydrogenase family)